MLQITDKGLVIERLNEIIERLSTEMRNIYGNDINIDPDTPDGQLIGIFSQSLADINEIIAGVYANSDPYTAVGNWLDSQVKYVGIERNREAYSYLPNVRLNVMSGTIIPSGYTVTDENGTEWLTTNSATATGATLVMQFRSAEYGAFHLPTNKELTPKTIVLGVQSVTTTSESIKGRLRESDASLLLRFMRSYTINSLDNREGLEAVLLSLPDVKDARVYENYTNVTDANGIEPHSINAIVIDGSDEDIATAIIKKKSLGCGVQGSNEVVIFYDSLDRIVKFDRATPVDVSVKVKIVRSGATIDVDTQSIKESVSSNQFRIGEDLLAGQLYASASGQDYIVKEILLNDTDLIASIGIRQYGRILIDNVEVIIE